MDIEFESSDSIGEIPTATEPTHRPVTIKRADDNRGIIIQEIRRLSYRLICSVNTN